jgi:hypothetical protein
MSRPDTYIIGLEGLKSEINLQIMHCKITLNKASEVIADSNYDDAATAVEKENIADLITLITNGLAALEGIVWE